MIHSNMVSPNQTTKVSLHTHHVRQLRWLPASLVTVTCGGSNYRLPWQAGPHHIAIKGPLACQAQPDNREHTPPDGESQRSARETNKNDSLETMRKLRPQDRPYRISQKYNCWTRFFNRSKPKQFHFCIIQNVCTSRYHIEGGKQHPSLQGSKIKSPHSQGLLI